MSIEEKIRELLVAKKYVEIKIFIHKGNPRIELLPEYTDHDHRLGGLIDLLDDNTFENCLDTLLETA